MSDIETVEIDKYCPRCKQTKPASQFYPSKYANNGLTTYCANCYADMQREFIKSKPPGWHYKNHGRRWYEENKDHELSRALKKNYGITLKHKKDMVKAQAGKCAICKKPVSSYGRKSAVDHDHANGNVRGILCANCNKLLGYAKDNTEILQSAIEYLERWN
jgi:hypothetical protein